MLCCAFAGLELFGLFRIFKFFKLESRFLGLI
jgi:hypothetical protein